MELNIDVYYRNKETGKYHIFHDTITEDDISDLIEEKNKNNLPIWMDKNWEFNSILVDKIDV